MAQKALIDVFERAKTWPEEDQEALAAYASALELTTQDAQRRYLERRMVEIWSVSSSNATE